MGSNLCRYGYPVLGYRALPERSATAVASGATAAHSTWEVVRRAEVVFTSLPCSEVFVSVAEAVLLPAPSMPLATAGSAFPFTMTGFHPCFRPRDLA